jgi:hypothetical protein
MTDTSTLERKGTGQLARGDLRLLNTDLARERRYLGEEAAARMVDAMDRPGTENR